jgi:hypothetical protein
MSNLNSEIDKIYTFEIDGIAYLEDRRFERAFAENYIFIKKTYLYELIPGLSSEFNTFVPVEVPLSLKKELAQNFIYLSELENILPFKFFNQLLKDLWTYVTGYDRINIVFDHIRKYKYLNSETIGFILNKAFTDSEIKNSFRVGDFMPHFIFDNLHIIDEKLIKKFLSEFTKPSNFAIVHHGESRNKYDEKIRRINYEIKFLPFN